MNEKCDDLATPKRLTAGLRSLSGAFYTAVNDSARRKKLKKDELTSVRLPSISSVHGMT